MLYIDKLWVYGILTFLIRNLGRYFQNVNLGTGSFATEGVVFYRTVPYRKCYPSSMVCCEIRDTISKVLQIPVDNGKRPFEFTWTQAKRRYYGNSKELIHNMVS